MYNDVVNDVVYNILWKMRCMIYTS